MKMRKEKRYGGTAISTVTDRSNKKGNADSVLEKKTEKMASNKHVFIDSACNNDKRISRFGISQVNLERRMHVPGGNNRKRSMDGR